VKRVRRGVTEQHGCRHGYDRRAILSENVRSGVERTIKRGFGRVRLWQHRIDDILESISEIQQWVQGMDFEKLGNDPKTIAAVIYKRTIMGEAAAQIPESIIERYPFHSP
jgi:hypothetical protein